MCKKEAEKLHASRYPLEGKSPMQSPCIGLAAAADKPRFVGSLKWRKPLFRLLKKPRGLCQAAYFTPIYKDAVA